jgi:hypothetical protein
MLSAEKTPERLWPQVFVPLAGIQVPAKPEPRKKELLPQSKQPREMNKFLL